MKLVSTAALTAAVMATGCSAVARDHILIAGSSTVLPYATIVAGAFGENFPYPTPVVESGGSAAGLKMFCQGVGENTIDIANASRPIRPSEIETCARNGVTEIIPVRFGYDGIVFASRRGGPSYAFTPADWYEALAAELPSEAGMVKNPNETWADVDEALPDVEITAFIPGTKHGTREVFDQKVIIEGCRQSGALERIEKIKEIGEDAAEKVCTTLRNDGAAVEIDGDYTEILARITSNPRGVGVFGLPFYESNTGDLQVATMNGVTPSQETIASGAYPVSRPLFFYVKKAHIGVIPGLKEYAEFFVSDEVAGPGGPLAEYGLVPDPKLDEVQRTVEQEKTLEPAS